MLSMHLVGLGDTAVLFIIQDGRGGSGNSCPKQRGNVAIKLSFFNPPVVVAVLMDG